METIQESMTKDHHRCDELFAEAEACVSRDHWAEAGEHLEAFTRAMERHFRLEEEALFPRFERATGITAGPTEVMRSEHAQMRLLIEGMADAAARRDQEEYLGQSETLLIIMQQHNAKEEQVLYPMADEAIGEDMDHIAADLGAA